VIHQLNEVHGRAFADSRQPAVLMQSRLIQVRNLGASWST